MVILSVVLAVLLVITFSCGLFVTYTKGYWLIDEVNELSDVQKQIIYINNNIKNLCRHIAFCLFSLCAYIVAIWCSCYFKIQNIIIISSIIEISFITFSVLYINLARKYKIGKKQK